MHRATLATLTLGAALAFGPGHLRAQAQDPEPTDAPAASTHSGVIAGVVTDHATKERLANAIVILQCSCLQGSRETSTNASGLYRFKDLPPGTYTIQVLVGQANVSKVTTLPRGAKFRANFSLNPKNEFKRAITVESARRIPRASQGRSFTSVVQMSGTATRDSAGISLAGATASGPRQRMHRGRWNTEAYDHIAENDVLEVSDKPLSTFSVDVDTAAYANMRRFIQGGSLPPQDAVRIEELLNYFDYRYAEPSGKHPFSVTAEVGPCPWNEDRKLVRIGLRGKSMTTEDTPARNLVFLIDVSGSMQDANKLPLVQQSLHLLVDQLREEDTVGLVVYAGTAGTVLPPTSGAHKDKIRRAIDALESGGSTYGEGGIREAYALAQRAFKRGGVNRVVLATDGDFNVGVSSVGGLTRLIEKKRESGIFLSVLGFGMYNLDDATMEALADKGNGNYAYIDNLNEARKVLVKEAGATLVTIAKDVKIQVEWNPKHVASYRLIGYENRKLQDRDFADDKKDAGEIGAGHTVTALYEIEPTAKGRRRGGPNLRYQGVRSSTEAAATRELMYVKLRYKQPEGRKSTLVTYPVTTATRTFEGTSRDFRHAAAVAAFGMLLRDSAHKGSATYDMVQHLVAAGRGRDENGYRAEFHRLVTQAAAIADRKTE